MIWIRLEDLRPGAIFRTKGGVEAVKTAAYLLGNADRDAQAECISLKDGEIVLFRNSDDILVQEIQIRKGKE